MPPNSDEKLTAMLDAVISGAPDTSDPISMQFSHLHEVASKGWEAPPLSATLRVKAIMLAGSRPMLFARFLRPQLATAVRGAIRQAVFESEGVRVRVQMTKTGAETRIIGRVDQPGFELIVGGQAFPLNADNEFDITEKSDQIEPFAIRSDEKIILLPLGESQREDGTE